MNPETNEASRMWRTPVADFSPSLLVYAPERTISLEPGNRLERCRITR